MMYPRDFRGYGPIPPDPQWPGSARVAVSLVVNIEEGAELSLCMGDERNEGIDEVVDEIKGVTDPCMESHFEYGTRVGYWRILRLLDGSGVKATFSTCARAIEHSPWMATEAVARGDEISCHRYRWESPAHVDEVLERDMITPTVSSIERIGGVRPRGWYSRSAPSMNTRSLLVEYGGFLYDSNAYNDELPYVVDVSGCQHVVVPYSFDTNDMHFSNAETFRLASDFSTHLIDSFSWLWREGERWPRLISVGLHLRIIGRPGRIGGLERFLTHIQQHKQGVWIARRDDIARPWRKRMGLPPLAECNQGG